ncbi:MAG TPA: P-II family nitrogen regulator [Dehalococcoidia bacterium]|nr:P-II family nitrogen regulator [Dehalococcoidia bacterium]
MKKVEAIVRPEMLSVVRKALEELGVKGVTITQVLGHGAQRGVTQQWKGNTYKVDLLPKVELKAIISDDQLEPVLQAIADSARTGAVGDGKVFVSTIDDVMRVRTGERGEQAV